MTQSTFPADGPPRLTQRDLDCLAAIERLSAASDRSPTFAELAQAMGLSGKAMAHWRCQRLRDAGYVTWGPGRQRDLRLLQLPAE